MTATLIYISIPGVDEGKKEGREGGREEGRKEERLGS